ncbi:MAG TPA: divergent PAP2 family protein [Oceanithermus profundus]|uniref:Divergent PAP2 family protein n=1 Tax=Oceanithermus profundus TaxID=187137 RepID=A0A7C4VK15_9DEIN|nr:divergent PAP2 family protein [Oceanithermus profundus]
MKELLANEVLWAAVIANVVAQSLKLVVYYLLERRWSWERLLESGGMPSSHSAMVTALATGVGLTAGLDSVAFAMALVFAMIVMYDATGIRRAAGQQAELLNDLVEELRTVLHEGFKPTPLKELLGHTYLEVLMGALLGVAVAWAYVLR